MPRILTFVTKAELNDGRPNKHHNHVYVLWEYGYEYLIKAAVQEHLYKLREILIRNLRLLHEVEWFK